MARLLKLFGKLMQSLFFIKYFSKKVRNNKSSPLTMKKVKRPFENQKIHAPLLGLEKSGSQKLRGKNKKLFTIIEVCQITFTDTFFKSLKAKLKSQFADVNHISLKKINSTCFTLTLNRAFLDGDEIFIQQVYEAILQNSHLFDKSKKNNLTQYLKLGGCYYCDGANQMMVYQLAQSALMNSQASKWLSYYFYSYKHTQTQLLALTSSDISQYIEKQRYVLLFQPVFSVLDGDILQHEALIRIRHESLGLLNASQLLPQVKPEQHKLRLDNAIVSQVLNIIHSETYYQQVSINIYNETWQDINFFKWLIDVSSHSNHGKCIVLELSEMNLINNEKSLLQVLQLLKQSNIPLILDKVEGAIIKNNFNYDLFVKYNIKSFKLNYSLVHNIHSDINKQRKVKEIISFAKAHFLPVFATGIEQKLELDTLKNLGVLGAQGHYFSEPLQELSAFSKVYL